jgi:hypothetical protein
MGDVVQPPPAASSNPKVLLGTAAITAAATVLVSFIGIVPQLRSGDKQELAKLKTEIDQIKQASVSETPRTAATKTMVVSGTLRSADGEKPLNGYDVYLLPEGNNLLTSKSDDSGRFMFPSVPDSMYSIIVRDSSNGTSGKGLLDEPRGQVTVIGAKVNYLIQR